MAMQKFSEGEGGLEVLAGREASVLHDFQTRLGVYKVSDFADADREQLMAALDEARKLDQEEQEERVEAAQERKAARDRKTKDADDSGKASSEK